LLLRPMIAFGWVRFRGLGKQTLDHRLGCPDIRFLGKHRTHGGHAFLVSLFSPSESDFAFPTGGLDHRHALAIDRSDQERAAVRGEPKATLPVEALKIYAGVGDDLLSKSTLASATICSAVRFERFTPRASASSSIASSKGPLTAALTRRRWIS